MVEPVYPQNHFTEMIERARAANLSGARAGAIDSVISAQPAPTVRSSALGPVVPDAPPLSPEEQAEFDAKAMELGLLPRSEQPDVPYVTMDAALEAGAPVEQQPRMTAREFVKHNGQRPTPQPANFGALGTGPRLPDFSRVQGIDLNLNVVYVDGMAFPIPEEDVREFRVYAMETAKTSIMKQFEAALNMLQSTGTEDRKDGEDSPVHSVRESERDSGSSEGGQPGVLTVPPSEQMEFDFSGDGATDTLRSDPS